MNEKQLKLLHYDCQRAMVRAYVASGRLAWICRTRQGNVRISLNGGRRLCIRDAMERIEHCLTVENLWHLANAA